MTGIGAGGQGLGNILLEGQGAQADATITGAGSGTTSTTDDAVRTDLLSQGPGPSGMTGTLASVPTPAGSATPPRVADQVAPAIVRLATGSNGAQSLTIRLDPVALGQIEIRIERTGDRTTRVIVLAERADTLALLRHDKPALEKALDQAGLSANARDIDLRLAAPEPRHPARTGPDQDSQPSPRPELTDHPNGDMSRQTPHQNAERQPSPQGSARRLGSDGTRVRGFDPTEAAPVIDRPPPGWQRIGLDITA